MATRVVRAVVRLAGSGQGDLKQLQPPMYGYRVRVGDWRVLVDLGKAGMVATTGGYARVSVRIKHNSTPHSEGLPRPT
ncbi:MAG: type II toxin-antitoxin system RelE family toxin [Anaerolineae bacterium]